MWPRLDGRLCVLVLLLSMVFSSPIFHPDCMLKDLESISCVTLIQNHLLTPFVSLTHRPTISPGGSTACKIECGGA